MTPTRSNMFDIKSFFAEQQRLMSQPEEEISEYLERLKLLKSKSSATCSFASDAIQAEINNTTSHSENDNLRNASHRPKSRARSEVAVEERLKLISSTEAPAGRASAGSKRSSEEHLLDQRSVKKARREDEVIVKNGGATSRARSRPVSRRNSMCSEIRGNPASLAGQDAEASMPPIGDSAREPAPDALAEARSSVVSADLRSAPTVSEGGRAPTPSGPPTSHQGKPRTSEPELPASSRLRSPSGPPLLFSNRRSTIADCSDVTSPPNTAPVDPTSNVPCTKGPGAVYGPGGTKNTARQESAKSVKGKRKKEKGLITPLEYAQKLQAQLSERAAGRKKQSEKPFLKGKRIFYYGGDLNYAGKQTRNRMEIITRHGGTLVPQYDPAEITHIVTDAHEHGFLRAVGLKKLSDIPQHIPTVKWSWVVSGFDRAPIRRPAQPGSGEGKGKAPERTTGQEHFKGVIEGREEYEYPMGHEFEHAAFKERIDAGRTPWGEVARMKAQSEAQRKPYASKVQSGAGRSTVPAEFSHSADDISNISDFTQDIVLPRGAATIPLPRARAEGLPSPPSSPGARQPGPAAHRIAEVDAAWGTRIARSPSRHAGDGARSTPAAESAVDPLAEFYASARAEREAEMFQDEDPDSDSVHSGKVPGHTRREVVKKGFACDDRGGHNLDPCPNQNIIDKLQELKSLHAVKASKDDEWRVLGYNKAIAALRKHPTRVKSYEEAAGLRGIGAKTAQKIMEIIDTGHLRRIEHERTADVAAIQTFLGIYGVGVNTASKWYNNGCRTLGDVAACKGGIKLSTEQEIGLRYYQDINTRIPRAEVEEIYDKIKTTALAIDPKLFIEVMGSYRRGKADCGDIDILISRPTDDGRTHQGVLLRLLRELHRQGVITEDLSLPDDFSDLESVYRGLCRKDPESLRRRIDFLTAPWASRGAALLYYTGDDIFNRSLRLKANKMGYSLNQRGLYAGVIRNPSDKRQKLHDGHIVASESEEEILAKLGVPWQEPHERVRG
ncbi:hypothetical protein C8Q79DRAFT_931196 [Trametes meyenii]|nr:hypothetical protein C8Q79DRAFT_931196 [Trametes meyenii]